MEIGELREKLTGYIQVADERKLNALYTLLEDEIESEYKWWQDEGLLKEMDEEVRKLEAGEIKGYTEEEVYESLQAQIDKHHTVHV